MKRLLSIVLAAALALTTVLPAQVSAVEKNSSSVTWKIEGDTLYIQGSGVIENHDYEGNAPWSSYENQIKKISKAN